jgi:Concanavalin A-like lectin/glucanases superfamily
MVISRLAGWLSIFFSAALLTVSARLSAAPPVAPSQPVPATNPAADASLIHRYSFTDAVKDSAGHVDGILKNAAKVSGGKLVLDNTGKTSADASLAYVEFPSSILPKSGSVSIVFWVTCSNIDSFARVIDFGDREGDQGRAFIYFTPRNPNDDARAAITATDTSAKTFIDTARLDDGKPHMAAIIIDDQAKKFHLFIDGKEPVSAADLGENRLAAVRPTHTWIGKSGFDQDGAFSGSLDELRIYNRAITLDEAAAMNKAGAGQLTISK